MNPVNDLNNRKTYYVAAGTLVFGILCLILPSTATWASPSNQDTIGILAVLLAANNASLRHAIYKVQQGLRGK